MICMKQLRTSILMLFVFTVITGIIYPALITGIGEVFLSEKINGSLIVKSGSVIGSELIGQKFEKPEYFHGRPSAVSYDAAGSGGSNYGPTNKKFIDQIKNRVIRIRKDFNLSENSSIPPDFVFASGSGLDPHISIESANLQAERIAAARKTAKSVITEIINSNGESQLCIYGSTYVNVLKLNSALDEKGGMK